MKAPKRIFIKSNISETQMEADISNYFGRVSSDTPLRLWDVDEQLTGADKAFYDQAYAIFMQFKVADGLKSISEVPRSTRKNKGKAEQIRDFRYDNNLNDNPSLVFELRAQAKTAIDFQHNILLEYADTFWSKAFYVAPTHLDVHEYYNSLFTSSGSLHFPFIWKKRMYHHDVGSWIEDVGFTPFLNEHVSIVPTEKVDVHTHYYSFSKSGSDIAWHSPSIVTRDPSRLSDQLKSIFNDVVLSNEMTNIETIDREFEVITDFEVNQDPFDNLKVKAKSFYNQTGIKMFVLLSNKEYISKYQQRT